MFLKPFLVSLLSQLGGYEVLFLVKMILEHVFLSFNPNTLENVRKEFNLDKPGAMDQAIDILESWIQKQEHFVKKDFSRRYLEGILLASKGSVEKTKQRLDRICTLRTMVPNLFEKYNARKDFPNMREFALNVAIPQLTEDDCRIHIGKLVSKQITAAACLDLYQHHRIFMEYSKMHDYVKGYYSIIDLGDVNVIEGMAKLDLIDLRNILTLITEGHGVRLMAIYVISQSNMIHVLINLVKQFLSAKLGDKIHVMKTVESIHEVLPKRLLPKDYGGDQKSTLEIFDELNEVVSTEESLAFYEEINRACTNESLRRSTDVSNQEYLGMPGSFKLLTVD